MEITVNHPLEGEWYCEETDQTIQINSYFDEGGDHFTLYGGGAGHNIWNYDYNIFSKELTIIGFERLNYSYSDFTVKLNAEVIDEKLYLDFIESSDGVVRFDKMVLIRID